MQNICVWMCVCFVLLRFLRIGVELLYFDFDVNILCFFVYLARFLAFSWHLLLLHTLVPCDIVSSSFSSCNEPLLGMLSRRMLFLLPSKCFVRLILLCYITNKGERALLFYKWKKLTQGRYKHKRRKCVYISFGYVFNTVNVLHIVSFVFLLRACVCVCILKHMFCSLWSRLITRYSTM